MATSKIAIILPGTTGSSLVTWGALKGAFPIVAPMWPTGVEADMAAAAVAAKLGNQQLANSLTQDAENKITAAGATSATTAPNDDSIVVPYQPTTSYGTLISVLQNAFGAGTPYVVWNLGLTKLAGKGNAVIGFGYDWRQDNTFSAQCLQTLLATIDAAWGRGNYEVVLVAHSMGGLVSRAYLENVGGNDPWLGNIKALITFGTPHLGAPLALDAAIGNQIFPSLNPAVVDDLVNNVDFPSTYQLLPPPGVPFVENLGTGGMESIYSGPVNTAVLADGASAANLAEAQQFFDSLDYTGNRSGVPYYAIWAMCQQATALNTAGDTLTEFTWSGSGNTLTPVWTGPGSNTQPGGDGIVPASSAQFTGFPLAGIYQALYASAAAEKTGTVSVNHFQLVTSPDALTQMGTWLNDIL